jgi:hypothetical protein
MSLLRESLDDVAAIGNGFVAELQRLAVRDQQEAKFAASVGGFVEDVRKFDGDEGEFTRLWELGLTLLGLSSEVDQDNFSLVCSALSQLVEKSLGQEPFGQSDDEIEAQLTRFDYPILDARLDQLLPKCNEGLLTPEEQRELDMVLRLLKTINSIVAKASIQKLGSAR